MDKVEDIRVYYSSESKFIQLRKVQFKQDGKPRVWDMIKSHDSVSILIHHIERRSFIFVKQFRPAVLVSQAATDGQDVLAGAIDTSITPVAHACTLELCAGLVDKKYSLAEIARQEVLEECGYEAPVSSFEKIIESRGAVGTTGNKQTMFYVEVTETMKNGPGGGNPEEGEFIDLVEMPVKGCLEKLLSGEVKEEKSMGLSFAVMWYNLNKK